MYILYGGRFTRSLMVEMVLAEGNIDYQLREIDILKNEHRSTEFLKINPFGWVPALITAEGVALYETHAINLYLSERHQLVHLAPRADETERGLFLSGLFTICGDLEPVMKRYYYPHRFSLNDADIPRVKQIALNDALDCLKVIDGRLSENGPYHLGDRFSLVDLSLSYWVALIYYLDVLKPFAAIRQCMNLVMSRPKLQPMFEYQIEWNKESLQSAKAPWSML
ncbi:MAG TPA: glutathione S-transferase family protein [Gammaproteobacteria bacterium]|nr:glutathione S-transferase family protein [Gammaproteobacteria bacterium]